MMKPFKEFLAYRIEHWLAGQCPRPGGSAFGTVLPAYHATLMRLAREPDTSYRSELDYLESDEAKRIDAVLQELATEEYLPSTTELQNVWYRLFPPSSGRADCEHCGGTGWRSLENPYGQSYAHRCDHAGGLPPVMPELPGYLERLYQQQLQEAEERRAMKARTK
jgi:hypothetical protein